MLLNAPGATRPTPPSSASSGHWIAVGLLPLLRLVAGYFLRLARRQPDRIHHPLHRHLDAGRPAITLSITPLRKLLNWPWLLRLRRTAGLLAFFYACLHFTTYIWFRPLFSTSMTSCGHRQAAVHHGGFAAFVLLVPLAATSNNAIIKRLGARLWQRIHYAVYLIAVLAVVHYWWLVKKDITQPAIYAAVFPVIGVAALLEAARRDSGQKTLATASAGQSRTSAPDRRGRSGCRRWCRSVRARGTPRSAAPVGKESRESWPNASVTSPTRGCNWVLGGQPPRRAVGTADALAQPADVGAGSADRHAVTD